MREDDGNTWESNVISIDRLKTFFADIVVKNADGIRLQNAHRIGERKRKTKTVVNVHISAHIGLQ